MNKFPYTVDDGDFINIPEATVLFAARTAIAVDTQLKISWGGQPNSRLNEPKGGVPDL